MIPETTPYIRASRACDWCSCPSPWACGLRLEGHRLEILNFVFNFCRVIEVRRESGACVGTLEPDTLVRPPTSSQGGSQLLPGPGALTPPTLTRTPPRPAVCLGLATKALRPADSSVISLCSQNGGRVHKWGHWEAQGCVVRQSMVAAVPILAADNLAGVHAYLRSRYQTLPSTEVAIPLGTPVLSELGLCA